MDMIFDAVGCNNASQCLSKSTQSTTGVSRIAFGASTSVAVASFSPLKDALPSITSRIHGHPARLSSVHWGSSTDGKDHAEFLLSGDASGQVRVHREADIGDGLWHSHVLGTCESSISALASIPTSTQTFYFAAASNGDVVVFADDVVGPVTTLSLGERHIVEAMAVARIDGNVVLALGGVDMQVHVYRLEQSDTRLVHVASLPGHKGWIRGLDFTYDGLDLLLASASQDQRIRLWRVTPSFDVTFDAMLVGHEDWVTSVSWVSPTVLLSSSMDNRMILWQMEVNTHLWVPQTRVGDLEGTGLLAATALSSDLVALTFTGQLHRWSLVPSTGHYVPAASVTGHTQSVSDVVWAVDGSYFVSVSLDQTARAFANVRGTWTEISRVQVHGYDLNCAAFVDTGRFVSGADEKILRVFDVPAGMASLVQGTFSPDGFGFLPELSLTTKVLAVDDAPVSLFVGDQLNRSVWPETHKLYGHGNELMCVASNHSRTLLASACKARDEQFASIWLWSTTDAGHDHAIGAVQQLVGHASTVVQLAFSHNDQYLVSVSKDRHVCLFAKDGGGAYALVQKQKAHKRIVWTCDWAPDDRVFATGSRDETLLLWGCHSDAATWQPVTPAHAFDSAVTAVAFSKQRAHDDHGYLVAVGLESGWLHFVAVDETTSGWHVHEIEKRQVHAAAIMRLAWHPTETLVATCSADSSVCLVSATVSCQVDV
ncbi:Aste57867_3695 [Aphanomyces stellatus]|uniref:Elongator complex protein 2 n=1 Tax=Aphanomyces stellatus TaxID=120398 RepID=A0A485KFN3_9STRA|nr:hypothetical protein As57867_003684 [Aphanomyces stellatus]VFT80850.1 Aste57867_3695 [Aphanomyces stellatus]